MKQSLKVQAMEEARKRGLQLLQPGDTVYTILRHVSRSGMMRRISPVLMGKYGPRHLDYITAQLRGARDLPYGGDGVRIGGCGMDMGFDLVYTMSRALWPDGFSCIGPDCRSNDHSNGDRDFTPHNHADGGYALRQRWL